MISNNWELFNKNVQIKNNKYAEYEDTEGNYAVFDPLTLLCGVQENELTEEQVNIAKFEGKIPKDMELKTKEVTRAVSKKEITGKDKDKYTLVNKKEQKYVVWFVIDGLKNMTAYNNQEEALKVAKAHNKPILELKWLNTQTLYMQGTYTKLVV